MSVPGKIPIQVERRPEFAEILREDSGFSSGNQNSTESAVNGWFDRLVMQSGLKVSGELLLSMCLFLGVSLGGPMLILFEMPLVAVVLGFAGMITPLALTSFFRFRRHSKILEQLPLVAEEMARFARTGRNLEGAFMAVAADTPAPLGEELLVCVRRSEMGLDLGASVRDLPERRGVNSLAMLTSAIAVNQETGGDLIQVLDRLATAVRDRLHFVARQRSATISSRLLAGMMLLVPFFIVGFFMTQDADYLNLLMASDSGRYSFWLGVILQILGAVVVLRILRRTSRF